MNWTIASDINVRIKDLRAVLGRSSGGPVTQEVLGRRAGVRSTQVSQWERGAQQPSRSRLERWCEREGWPVTIFAEGHTGPTVSVSLSGSQVPETTTASDVGIEDERAVEVTRDQEGDRAKALLAEFYRLMACAAEEGRPLPPELAALVHELYHLTGLGPKSSLEDNVDGLDSSQDVPGW